MVVDEEVHWSCQLVDQVTIPLLVHFQKQQPILSITSPHFIPECASTRASTDAKCHSDFECLAGNSVGLIQLLIERDTHAPQVALVACKTFCSMYRPCRLPARRTPSTTTFTAHLGLYFKFCFYYCCIFRFAMFSLLVVLLHDGWWRHACLVGTSMGQKVRRWWSFSGCHIVSRLLISCLRCSFFNSWVWPSYYQSIPFFHIRER